MRDVITHRGPDGAGLHSDSHCVLAHRRLSIVDLAGGHQPLSNEDGTVWITYNGEIYNHADVRSGARRLRAIATARRATPRRSFTVTKSGAMSACTASAGCSRSPSGTHASGDCCSCATGLASSRCTGLALAIGCSSPPRSSRSSRAVLSQQQPNEAVIPEVLATRSTSGAGDAVPRHLQAASRPSAGVRERRACASSRYLGPAARRP